MDKIAVEVLKDQLHSLNGLEFQDAIDNILSIIHEQDYTIVKQKRDKGCDGILNNQTILAAYAPERYSLTDFKKKTFDDYEKYQKNWQVTYPKWAVITNLESTSSMIQYVDNLYCSSELISVNDLVTKVRSVSWIKTIRIFRALGIPERYYTYDLFSYVIEDIIGNNVVLNNIPYEKPIYIQEKISLNIESEEQKLSFTEEYEEYFDKYQIIENILSSYSSEEVLSLRTKIRSNYYILSGDTLQRILNLTNILAGNRNDDIYKQYIRILIFYFFEQCLIGIKTNIETNI